MEEDRNHLIYNQEQPAETVLYPAPVVNQQRYLSSFFPTHLAFLVISMGIDLQPLFTV